MRPLLYTSVLILALASTGQNAIAQRGSSDRQSEDQWEGEFSSPVDREAPNPRPKLKRVSEISLNLFDQQASGSDGEIRIPEQIPMPTSPSAAPYQVATPKIVRWTAPEVGYRRLIFEEPGLERHGFTDTEVRQHIRSSAKFYARSIALPIIVFHQRNCPCDNNLGWGTPGTCPR